MSIDLLKESYISFLNLPHRTDRLVRMEKTLLEVGLSAVRTEGRPPSAFDLTLPKLQVMRNRTPGAIGCHYGQVEIMETALRQGRHAFVMEDDLVFCEDFFERIAILENFLKVQKQWDVLWLGGTFHVNPPHWHKERDAMTTWCPWVMRTFGAFCTYAYIVNRDSLPRVLRRLEDTVPRSMGIDWAFIQLQPELLTFAFVPGCITQYDNRSDIGNGITRFSNFGKEIPWFFAKRMGDFDPAAYDWHEAQA